MCIRDSLSDAYLERHEADIPLMVRASVRRNRKDGVIAMLEGLLRDPGMLDELEAISLPTLILGGDQDRFATPAHLQRLHARFPGAQLEILEGVGHTLAIEAPERFFETVDAFLRA